MGTFGITSAAYHGARLVARARQNAADLRSKPYSKNINSSSTSSTRNRGNNRNTSLALNPEPEV